MVDIILAEHSGQAWLVSGEQYIDDLLANTLAGNVSIEIVVCESDSEVAELWHRHGAEPAGAHQPWLIHPGIVARIRREAPGHSIYFPEWSAMLDKEARRVIQSAAAWAQQFAEAAVALVRYPEAGESRPTRELAGLRLSLVESELEALGIDAARFVRVTRAVAEGPSVGPLAQRVDIEVKAGAT
jgi:hypothetical protein